MLTPVPPSDCARARESASARLDGELAELQAVQLEAHLRFCEECRAYASGIDLITRRLRAAPLEQPPADASGCSRERLPLSCSWRLLPPRRPRWPARHVVPSQPQPRLPSPGRRCRGQRPVARPSRSWSSAWNRTSTVSTRTWLAATSSSA